MKGHELVAAFGKYFNQDRGQFLGVFFEGFPCWLEVLRGDFEAFEV